MTSGNLESVNAIPRRYLNVDAKIQIDMDNTAEAYLKRGISKKNFLEFVRQIVDMQQKCMENGLHADFDLKQIEVVNEHVLFKVYVGDSGLQIVEIKEYLKTLAYTAVFQGEDFLQTVYEYLSFMDQTGIITLGQIADKIHFWLTGESVQVATAASIQYTTDTTTAANTTGSSCCSANNTGCTTCTTTAHTHYGSYNGSSQSDDKPVATCTGINSCIPNCTDTECCITTTGTE